MASGMGRFLWSDSQYGGKSRRNPNDRMSGVNAIFRNMVFIQFGRGMRPAPSAVNASDTELANWRIHSVEHGHSAILETQSAGIALAPRFAPQIPPAMAAI